MDLKIYTGYDKYHPRGTVTISYDRISHINLYIPRAFAVRWSIEREAHYDWCEKTGEKFTTHHIYRDETDYKFTIKKLSKADIPYRKGGMTHQLLSNDLMNRIDVSHLYTKLKWWEVVKITFNLKKYVWQTKEFKKHIYYYAATSLVSFIGGLIVGWKILKPTTPQNESSNTITTNDSTAKVNRVPPVNKSDGVDSSAQYSLKKVEDSLTKTKADTTTAITQ